MISLDASAISSNSEGKSVIKLTAGSSTIYVNDKRVTTARPYISGGVFYIPARAVLEAIGADVNWLGGGKLSVIYRNVAVDLKTGTSTIYVNGDENKLEAPPVLVKGTLMLPSGFISKCLSSYASVSTNKKSMTITMENDGALSDLSFLTGSIIMPRVGNSWFGWSMDILKGSRIYNQSFNSKYVYLENEHYKIGVEITAEEKTGNTFEAYYSAVLDDPFTKLGGELISKSVNKNAAIPYMEFLYTDSYDEAVLCRVFNEGSYFIKVAVTSYSESDPSILKGNSLITSMLDSIKKGFKGSSDDTADLSKISSDGLAEYDNYIYSDTTSKKYFTWKMDVLPQWDLQQDLSDGSYDTVLGTGAKENITVELSSADGETDAETYGASLEDDYMLRFNPDYFTLVQSGPSKVGEHDAYSMVFDILKGSVRYTFEERVLISGGIVYDITLKSEKSQFPSRQPDFERMLKTFRPASNDLDIIVSDWSKYVFNQDKNMIDKDSETADYVNKSWGWKFQCPGDWHRNTSFDQAYETFYNNETGSVVTVEAIQNSKDITGKSDLEKFMSVRFMNSMGMKQIDTYKENDKGTSITVYKYRIENDEEENYSDITFRIIQNDKYSYCFMESIPDMTSTEANKAVLEDMWKSFTLIEAED
jgi:hypothetical protein